MTLNLEKVKSGSDPALRGGGWAKGRAIVLGRRRPPALTVMREEPRMVMRGLAGGLQGVLFDLDGVLVDTARFHFLAWKQLAEELGVAFNERINHGFRGVSRMACLEMLLGEHERFFADEEKRLLAERKNGYYLELVKGLEPRDLVKGAQELAENLRAGGVRVGLVSASRNARLVLRLLGITNWFDAIVDGSECEEKRDGFLRAAEKMQVPAEQCVVVEDAEAGVIGARTAGMKCVGIGAGAAGADVRVSKLEQLRMETLEKMAGGRL